MREVLGNMKSVMIFSPDDTQEETDKRWEKWLRDNNQVSAVGDKYVPNAAETRRMLNAK